MIAAAAPRRARRQARRHRARPPRQAPPRPARRARPPIDAVVKKDDAIHLLRDGMIELELIELKK